MNRLLASRKRKRGYLRASFAEKLNPSILNLLLLLMYLNEVLYLFENVDVDAIVFEDMDRFNANKIFERLREINNLVNLQISKKRKKPLRFFYLLRDDIFTSKDRTKFFDFIIPVIPVVDGSNSYEQLIELLKENKMIYIMYTMILLLWIFQMIRSKC